MAATVLLTGVTGFVGGALAARLLDAHPDVRLLLCARSRQRHSPRERVLASLRRFSARDLSADADRIDIVEADLAVPQTLAALPLGRCTHVVHLAVAAEDPAGAANRAATLALAQHAARTAPLARFLYVGSAWSCGAVPSGVVTESEQRPPAGPVVAEYLRDKAEIEELLAQIPGLPLLVARPSLAVGHTSRGCEPCASLFWVLRLLHLLGEVPWPRAQRLDVVPVDWLAEALASVLFAQAPAHRLYHLSAGRDAHVTWGELAAAFARRQDGPQWRFPAAPVSPEVWLARVADRLPPQAAPLRATLLSCLRFFAGDVIFDNSRALQLGVPTPPPLTAYLDVCLAQGSERTLWEQALDDV